MYVGLTPTGQFEIHEPDDFGRLSIVAISGHEPSEVINALVAAGLAVAGSSPTAIELDVAVLRASARSARAVSSVEADWEQSFDAMLEYARRKGWYTPSTNTVAVHIAWPDGDS
ncbi:hypothetical protein [Nocardia rhamnosiphila]|uniref:Uncharacterized protein n=1 Tax=Nocardia rhamnosiphila TaxID=426716 RepID=A0ABV2WRD5_9NOCA